MRTRLFDLHLHLELEYARQQLRRARIALATIEYDGAVKRRLRRAAAS